LYENFELRIENSRVEIKEILLKTAIKYLGEITESALDDLEKT